MSTTPRRRRAVSAEDGWFLLRSRMVAYTPAALVGQLAHRRLSTDDNVTALVLDGPRRRGAG